MGIEHGIASTGPFRFDVESLLAAASAAFPSTEVLRSTGEPGEPVDAVLYVPTASPQHRMEVAFYCSGLGLSVENGTAEDLANFISWVARTARVPADGSVFLGDWGYDAVPLTPDITAEELLAARR